MRALAASLVLVGFAACGGDDGGNSSRDEGVDADDPGADDGPPFRGFELKMAPMTLASGNESTYCFYFQTPNTEPMAITKWSSTMTEGSHHMIVFLTGTTPVMPPGSVSSTNCGFGQLADFRNAPVWTYAAQTAENSLALPTDDGAGLPVALTIPPGTYGFVQMHYQNFGDTPVEAETTIVAEALPAAQAYTPTAAFVTYDASILIQRGPNMPGESKRTCTTPTGAKFWSMTTHTHKQAVRTAVRSGMPTSTELAFESTDWEHPGVGLWSSAPFYSFTDEKVTVTCSYNNPTTREITTGDDPLRDEQCIASGYYFPATEPTFCACSGDTCINY